jgi:hypothetical protein
VRYQGNIVTWPKSGKPAAVLAPVELFERWKAERSGALAPMRRIDELLARLNRGNVLLGAELSRLQDALISEKRWRIQDARWQRIRRTS